MAAKKKEEALGILSLLDKPIDFLPRYEGAPVKGGVLRSVDMYGFIGVEAEDTNIIFFAHVSRIDAITERKAPTPT